jgi:hypothetical protein
MLLPHDARGGGEASAGRNGHDLVLTQVSDIHCKAPAWGTNQLNLFVV